jgi:maleate isomerase
MGEVTFGVLTPHAAPGPEVEIPALTRGRVDIVVVRVGSPTELTASTAPGSLQVAAQTFRAARVDAVAHASTTTGYLIGAGEEALLISELVRLCGVPAVTSCAAAVSALRAGGVERVQLVHPPWFPDSFDHLGVAYFRSQGFQAAATKARDLPRDPALVEPEHVVDWVQGHLDDQTDGVYLAGNGFRTAATVDALQRSTGKTVVSANQALLTALMPE